MFLLYMIDLHNHNIDNRVDIIANPLNPKRKDGITQKIEAIDKTEQFGDEAIENLVADLENQMKIVNEKTDKDDLFENCFKTIDGEFICNFCPGKYKREGHLRNHLESKHNKKFRIVCVCGKEFPDSSRLSRHKKTCKVSS